MLETETVNNYGYTEAPGNNFFDTENLKCLKAPLTSPAFNNFSTHMESSAARLEETLELLNLRYQTLFFLASAALVTSSVFSVTKTFGFSTLPGLLLSLFLLTNSLLVMVLDIPGTPRWAAKYRRHIRKNMRFLTRLTGKSLWLAVLGASNMVTLKSNRRVGALRFLFGTLTSLFVFAVAAVRKSFRLEKARNVVKETSKGAYIDVFRKYALSDPDHGMQFEEFNRLCSDYTSGRLQFDIVDLYIIFNVLDEHQKCAVNEREFYEWLAGSLVFL
ncbi:uncharacterized protein TA11505 [Theileria annulata]|uniref:COPI associated protein n=1 Tax=Theileria annulata TaxID=5874 RepID=Q4UDI8_THEAN|nr:uncharacterized protein TA11505 [Theileria annulata]CAI74851.1 hypothetical protein, conserved [Theileria annulata]|eukprot:XP_952583.1 hypothetical protein, conserved [Theileria annulata]